MSKGRSRIRRPEIIDAAMRSLSENGLPPPSYDQIAREAGMSRQLIRHYFPTHEALMIAVCDHIGKTFRTAILDHTTGVAPQLRLSALLDFYFQFLKSQHTFNGGTDTTLGALFSLSFGYPSVRESLREQFLHLEALLAVEIRTSHPSLDETRSAEIAHLFCTVMHGHARMTATLGSSSNRDRAIQELLESVIERGLAQEVTDKMTKVSTPAYA